MEGQGEGLSRPVLSGWVNACSRLMASLEEALRQYAVKKPRHKRPERLVVTEVKGQWHRERYAAAAAQ